MAAVTDLEDARAATVAREATPALQASDIRSRAASGAFLLTLQGIAQQCLGFVSTIVVTRLLAPKDLGIVALAVAISGVVSMVSGGQGMAGALIRREEPPDRADLEAFLGLQLGVNVVLAVTVAALTLPFGIIGRVTAIMVVALPLTALRAPGAVILERELLYRRLTAVESSESFVYYAWTVSTVAAGWGIWGLASATAVRFAVGTVLMLFLVPNRVLRPRFDYRRVRSLLGIGIRVQAVELTSAVRDQALLSLSAAINGLTVVGLWSLVQRLLQVPGLLFYSLVRVSFPAMSRLRTAGEDPAETLPKLLTLAAILTGALLIPLAAAAPSLVPALFGHRWSAAADALPPACLGLVIVMPLTIAGNGYLWAVGDAKTPLRATVADSLVIVAVALPLVHWLGAAALAIGLLVSAVAHSWILGRGIRRRFHIDLARSITGSTAIWLAAAAPAWACNAVAGPRLAVAVLAGAVGLVGYSALVAVFQRDAVRELVTAVRPRMSSLVARVRPAVT
jgi:O-antigen/teichoic acid export membrane protein